MGGKPIPIHFSPGSWGGLIDGSVRNITDAQRYSIDAQAGQFLTLMFDGGGPPDGMSGDPMGAQVFDPNGKLLNTTNPKAPSGTTIQLPVTGTFEIAVGLDNMEEPWAGTFTLCVLVVNGERPI